ncbi:MAG: hypothetical protein AAEJ04_00730 [Planctomycetota bacterium]
MRVGTNEKLALIPLVLCILLWLAPGSGIPPEASVTDFDSGEKIVGSDTTVVAPVVLNAESKTEIAPRSSSMRWQPSIQIVLLGLFSSALIWSILRAQDGVQARARQLW